MNFKQFHIVYLLLSLTTVTLSQDDPDIQNDETKPELEYAHMHVTISAKRVFRFALNPNLFHWESGNFGGVERPKYRYTPFVKDEVDMPKWMKYQYSERHKAGFIYGVPPVSDTLLDLDIIALNEATYEAGLLRLHLNITSDHAQAPFSVKLKIDNLNLVDMFDAHRLRNLKSLFKDLLWPQSRPDLHLTFIASSLDVGYRRPLDPSQRDGTVVFLGSHSNFSSELFDLDLETTPLRKSSPCPRDFKRTTVERHFRAKGFALDWCEFRLMELDEDSEIYKEFGTVEEEEDELESEEELVPAKINQLFNESLHLLEKNKELLFPDKNHIPKADWTREYILVAIPTILIGIFLFSLVIILFFVKCPGMSDREDRWDALTESFCLVIKDCFTCCEVKEKEQQSAHVRADQDFRGSMRSQRASSVARQTDTLKRLAAQRDVTPRLTTPAPGLNPYQGHAERISVTANPNFDEGGPIILMPESDSLLTESREITPEPQFVADQSRMATLSRIPRLPEDPLGSLRRPVPPSYYDQSGSVQIRHTEDGAYLV